MIKIKSLILFTTIVLSSCTGFDYFQAAPLLKNSVMGYQDTVITDQFINQQEYSFAKIKIGKSSPVILSLAYIENDVYEWISGDGERVYTLNGKIIKTVGLVHNFHLITSKELPSLSLLPITQSRLVELTNPDAFISQTASIKVENENQSLITISEEITTNIINWEFTNTYLIESESGLVVQSIQYIHPKLSKFAIEYFYKF